MLLDVRGEMCPYPAMKTREALKKLKAGDDLVVLTDHAPALNTIPWEGAKQGYDTEIEPLGNGEWRLTLRKVEGAFDPRQALARLQEKLARAGAAG
jgi:tRNA 2-thiouridine synthesizing protein A